jgi:ABC-type cobalamin/Fe3+-siderophores transport system ATPase subunit
MDALYVDEADVVGFEVPKKILIDWMVKGMEERTVISVVGMGGQGKTTLVKKLLTTRLSLDTLIVLYGSRCLKHIMLKGCWGICY